MLAATKEGETGSMPLPPKKKVCPTTPEDTPICPPEVTVRSNSLVNLKLYLYAALSAFNVFINEYGRFHTSLLKLVS